MEQHEMVGGFADALGVKVAQASGDRVLLTLSVRAHMWQEYGILHGGVHSSLVETAASIAAAMWLGDRGQVVGVSNQTDFFHPVREGELRAVATPVHRDQRQQLWTVHIIDEQERKVAQGKVRLQNLEADHLPRGPSG